MNARASSGMMTSFWGQVTPSNPTVTIEGVRVSPIILANAAHPMQRWLVSPFTGALNAEQASFNQVHG